MHRNQDPKTPVEIFDMQDVFLRIKGVEIAGEFGKENVLDTAHVRICILEYIGRLSDTVWRFQQALGECTRYCVDG